MSTFMGLETSKRGLFTQQTALYTTGHNISNANTLGYSRQRVNMEATAGFPGVGLGAGTMPGFLGTGVTSGSIQRIRDGFVDHQFRQESTKFGYWESRSNAISQMEDVMNEPSFHGLQKSFSEFWQSLQNLAAHPNESGTRAVVVRGGAALADSFNYMHKSLTDVQTNLGKEIDVSTGDVNSILQQIAGLNRQISEVEPNGYLPNDLYDVRDVLLDELSGYFPIETTYKDSGGRALAIAEGSVTVSMKINGKSVVLVEGGKAGTVKPNPKDLIGVDANDTVTNKPIQGISIWGPGVNPAGTATETIAHDKLLDAGKIKSLMNSYGTVDSETDGTPKLDTLKGLYPDMLAELDKMVEAFALEFNAVHADGYPKVGDQDLDSDLFFVKIDDTKPFSADNIKVNQFIIDDPNLFRASTAKDEEGNGKNAQLLADIQSKGLGGLGGATTEGYFQSVIGKLGVEGMQAERLALNTVTLLGAVAHRRDSISAVSLDEEMTDMIRFQQAYNASARMITVVDETLDKIINGMGVVGR